ncbi:MAG: zinc ribbon domain-containing protein [Kiritimatiellae bacterium]|nr:zinc ribbon domain-containing protein [Kiritimatiellia bacterium]
MGLFSNICNALIDKNTGRALTGDALVAAQKDPNWPTCGNKVSKRAQFCNKCGKPAPGGWWRCPQCNKWIANDSHFCPHCNAVLYPDDRVDLAGGVWQKEPGRFAQRFETGDVKRLLTTGLKVQEGTVAILLDTGAVSDILQPGQHKPESLLRKINWFGNPPPRSVVLIDAGEVIVPLQLKGLRTSEHIPIEFYGELVLRFKGDKDAARAFCSNVLKGDRTYTFAQIAGRVELLIRSAVDEMCITSTIEDLVKDPERRIRLQERIEKRIAEDFTASGLEIVRVSSAEFTGDEYENLEEQLGDAEVKRREAEYHAALDATLRKIHDKAEMDSAKAALDLRQYKEMLDNEYRVSATTRDREFALLKREWEHDDLVYRRLLEVEELQHKYDLENRQTEHELATKRKLDEYGREKKVEDAKADVQAQDIHTSQDVKDSEIWLKVKEQKMQLKQKDKSADASRRKGMSLAEMLLDTEDPDARAAILEAMRLQRNASTTPMEPIIK